MNEEHTRGGHAPDRELNIKAVIGAGVALVIATALGMGISWWLSTVLRTHIEGEDPPPPTLVEAQMPYEPPSPNLQVDPATELTRVRAEEDVILETYEWTDASRSRARVPIERGMQLLLETRPGAEALVDEEATPREGPAGETPGGDRPVEEDPAEERPVD